MIPDDGVRADGASERQADRMGRVRAEERAMGLQNKFVGVAKWPSRRRRFAAGRAPLRAVPVVDGAVDVGHDVVVRTEGLPAEGARAARIGAVASALRLSLRAPPGA